MTIKKWVYLFWTTLLIGGVVAVVVGFAQELFAGLDYGEEWLLELLISTGLKLWAGIMYSVVSQLGFFAFLVLNFLLISTFKNSRIYQAVLWVLLAFAFVYVIYLRHLFFAEEGEGIFGYVWFPLFLLLISLLVAWWKSRATNFKAFASTTFFMFAITLIELLPALRENNTASLWFMLIPLLACNTWQIMQLHRLLKPKASEPNRKSLARA